MFGFFQRQKADDVRRLLSRHMNRDFLTKFRFGKRTDARGSFCRPVWIVPLHEELGPRFDEAFPAITKDIGPEGLSLIDTEPLEHPVMLVGLEEDDRIDFVRCTLEHSTPVGLGFHQIGLHPEEVVRLSAGQRDQLRRRAADVVLQIDEPCCV